MKLLWYSTDVEIITAVHMNEYHSSSFTRGPIRVPLLLHWELKVARRVFKRLNDRVIQKMDKFENGRF